MLFGYVIRLFGYPFGLATRALFATVSVLFINIHEHRFLDACVSITDGTGKRVSGDTENGIEKESI